MAKGKKLSRLFIMVAALTLFMLWGLMPGEVSHATSTTKLHFLAVAQDNNFVLIESNGKFGVIDTGEDEFSPEIPDHPGITQGHGIEEKAVAYLKSVGVNSDNLEFYIGSHPHSDHIGNAPIIIREFKPKRLYTPEYKDEYVDIPERMWDNQYVYDEMIKAAKETGTEVITIFDDANTKFKLGDADVELFNYDMSYRDKVASISDANDICLGVKVVSKEGISAFIGGDINAFSGTESRIQGLVGPVSIATVNHHGYAGSNSPAYVEALNADVLVLGGRCSRVSVKLATPDATKTSHEAILERVKDGTLAYSTGAYAGRIPALIFQLDDSLTNNLPKGTYDTLRGGHTKAIGEFDMPMKDGQLLEDGLKTDRDGHWVTKPDGTYFLLNDGKYVDYYSVPIDGKLYSFDSNGKMRRGWVGTNYHYYYFGKDGVALRNSWVEYGGNWYYLDEDGYMVDSDWNLLGGKWYYFNEKGIAAGPGWNRIEGKWYYMDAGNAMVTGWLQLGSTWYYLDDGVMAESESKMINGVTYQFSNTGAMMTGGWNQNNGHWCWVETGGSLAVNCWKQIGKTWYYFDGNGVMAQSEAKDIGGTTYLFDGSGAMMSGGWKQLNGHWYWLEKSGAVAANSWKHIGNVWYYFDGNGVMAQSEAKDIGGTTYLFDGNGAMMSGGWKQLNGHWYWLEKSGAVATNSWKHIGNVWYYFDGEGVMAASQWKDIDGASYCFDGSGAMVSSAWRQAGGKWYWLESSGAMMKSGWKQIGQTWYLFDGAGAMADNCLREEGGATYCFNDGGAMVSSAWKLIDGKWYYFGSSGAMVKNASIGGYVLGEDGAMLEN